MRLGNWYTEVPADCATEAPVEFCLPFLFLTHDPYKGISMVLVVREARGFDLDQIRTDSLELTGQEIIFAGILVRATAAHKTGELPNFGHLKVSAVGFNAGCAFQFVQCTRKGFPLHA